MESFSWITSISFKRKNKVVSVNQVSNALGIVNPIEEIIARTRKNTDAYVVIDGAQSAPHFNIDVQKMDCDFFVFSGHKCMLRWEQGFYMESVKYWKLCRHSMEEER